MWGMTERSRPRQCPNRQSHTEGESAANTLSLIPVVTIECYSTKEIAGIALKRPAPWARSR